jgi:hypothetical protein
MILITLIVSQLLVNIWMFYAKGALLLFLTRRVKSADARAVAVNCCAEVVAILDSGPDGGNCASPADCRGFTGNCADIVDQFADLPVLPDFPNGMADYTCTAFPNEDNPIDSFIVGLSASPRRACFLAASDARLHPPQSRSRLRCPPASSWPAAL